MPQDLLLDDLANVVGMALQACCVGVALQFAV
jgi:hypothetical protein